MKIFLWLFLFAAPLLAADRIDWTTNYDQALQTAKQEGKPVVLFFNASWCGPCQKMKEQIFSQRLFADKLADKFVWVSIVENQALMKQYGVSALPAVIILNSNGQRVGQIKRARGEGVQSMIDKFQKFISSRKQTAAKGPEEESPFF